MARNLTPHWRWLTGLTILSLAAGFAAPLIGKPPLLQEKRALAEFPAWPRSPGDLKAFRNGVDSYVADRFPARPYLISALNRLRLPLGVSGSDRVILGRDGWMFYDNDTHLGAARNDPATTMADIQQSLMSLAGRREALQRTNIPYLVVVAPLKETLYPAQGPSWYRGPDPARCAVVLGRWAELSQAGHLLYLYDALAQPTAWGLKTFSPSDTHWTGLGAHEGYVAIMERLRTMGVAVEPALPITAFQQIPADAEDPRDLSLMLGLSTYRPGDYPQFEPAATAYQAHTDYLSDNHSWTGPRVIDTGEEGKPVLLITVDSFSNALLPFLYGHFSRLIIAHNQDGFWRDDLIGRFKPDLVILETVESNLPFALRSGPAPSDVTRDRITAALQRPLPPLPRPIAEADRPRLILGTRADDDIRGRRGGDTLDGMAGNDSLHGGRGGDLIRGGDGDDWLSGDRGDDTLWGGAGADSFHGVANSGTDRIMDFSVAQGDRIELEPGAKWTITQSGADAVVTIDGEARMILVGVKATTLRPDSIRLRH